MTEMSELYKVPAPEEVNDLLKGDYSVDEAAPENHPPLKTPPGANCETPIGLLSEIVDTYLDTSISVDLASEMLEEMEAMGWRLVKFSSTGAENSSTLEEGENFIKPVIPKAWLPGAVWIDLYDDGWEVRQHSDPLDEDISSSGWSDKNSEELAMLRRIKNELAGSLQKIYIYADQIETNNQALLENSFDDDEQRGVEIMDRYLAAQIKVYIRRHLKIDLEVTGYDIFS